MVFAELGFDGADIIDCLKNLFEVCERNMTILAYLHVKSAYKICMI